ncbi:MAG: DUF1934 domain-containing protein [Clostridia bacterium]|nr:DUF1934 domain-containing protein [Clostridia bacterium]
MIIPVDITIKTDKTLGDPLNGGNRREERELKVPGLMRTTKTGLLLQYDEPDEESRSVTTLIDLPKNGMVMMNRGGDAGMIFEQGKTHSCVFHNGVLPMEIRVRTAELKNTISKAGGRLDVDYTVDIIASRAEQSHLSLSVKPQSRNSVS